MSRWYRRYAGTVSDPKIAEAAMIAECSRAVVIATWDMILESAAEVNASGEFKATSRNVAATMVEQHETIMRVFAALETLGMISGTVVSAWSKRQFCSDNSTERSRRYRKKVKENNEPEKDEHCATLQGRCETVPDTDTDTDTEDSEVKSQPATKVETEAACVRADLSEAEQALDEMISSIRSWGNSMNIVEARTWLSTTVRTYGQRPTARAYHQLKTELQTGQLIGHPLRAWGSIAERFRAEDAERKAAKDAPPKISKTREAINRRLAKQAALAAEMEAKTHG